MEDRYDIRVDVGEGKDWWHIHGLSTHDKVYELNRQMCDVGNLMSTQCFWDEVYAQIKASREATEKRFSKYNKLNEDIMKEKKTNKMTKAEAFEYLKGKKIKCICAVAYEDAQANKVERFLKDVGCKYHFANHISWRDWYWPLYGFIVDSKGEIYVAFEDQMDFFKQNLNEPISVDDILSIEIVDGEDNIAEKNAFQKARDIMKWLREEQSPHTLMIIDGYHVELLDGVKAEVWKE